MTLFETSSFTRKGRFYCAVYHGVLLFVSLFLFGCFRLTEVNKVKCKKISLRLRRYDGGRTENAFRQSFKKDTLKKAL